MEKSSTYRKTPLGAEAISSRDRALQPRQRSLLILVDGKRTVDELSRMTPTGIDESLGQLLQLGFIEPCEGVVAGTPAHAAAQAPSSAPAPLPAEHTATVPLAQAQRFAVRRLSDMLGPAADDICLRIERARTAQEFQAVLLRALQYVDANLGAGRAREFAGEMEAHRPE